jgi:SAM-dependent methyltransferase
MMKNQMLKSVVRRFPYLRQLFKERDDLRRQSDTRKAETDALVVERDQLRRERDQLAHERDVLRGELGRYLTWVPPGHFYSPIPCGEDVKRREKEIFHTIPDEVPGIDLNEKTQLALFREFKEFYNEITPMDLRTQQPVTRCLCCGSTRTRSGPVLWKELIDEWRIAEHEVAYIDRQQGFHCEDCECNLRAMCLSRAVMACYGFSGLFKEFARSEAARRLDVLEINEAHRLTQFLAPLPEHQLVRYPDVDILKLPFEDGAFDLVVHSDTLEHVPHPVRGLSECRRVLRPGGFCAFTVPMIVDRLTASRKGLRPSYHGAPDNPADFLVHTEYGADAWKHLVLAGFAECRIFSLEYPAAQALVGVR